MAGLDPNWKPHPKIVLPIAKYIRYAVLGVFAGIFALGSFFTVHETERAVVTRNGSFLYVASPGFHLKFPFIDRTSTWSIALIQMTVEDANTYTSDNQEVDATMIVQYRIPENQVENLFKNNPDYSQKVKTVAIDRLKAVLGTINVVEFANTRGDIKRRVNELVTNEVKRLFQIEVIDVSIPNVNYKKEYLAAVARAAQIKTEVEGAQNSQRKAEIDAHTAKIQAAGLAEAAIQQARGSAEARVLAADADARSRLLVAEAEAKSITLRGRAEATAKEQMASALSANPVLVQYEQAMRWNGSLPVNLYGSAPIPFMSIPTR